jgi:hypothetical protein
MSACKFPHFSGVRILTTGVATVAPNVSLHPRALGLAPEPVRPCCLRCSKRQANEPGLECVTPMGNALCSRCSGKHKPCHVVPPSFIPRLNALLDLSDRVARLAEGTRDRRRLKKRLDARQKEFTKLVELFIRRSRVQAPQVRAAGGPVDSTSVLLGIHDTLVGILDVMRYGVHVFSLFWLGIILILFVGTG